MWISCYDESPEIDDGDYLGRVWACKNGEEHIFKLLFIYEVLDPFYEIDYWRPYY